MSRSSGGRSKGKKLSVDYSIPPVIIDRGPEDTARMVYVMTNPDKLSRRALQLECPCVCHDMTGGNAHKGQACICNGGEGMWP